MKQYRIMMLIIAISACIISGCQSRQAEKPELEEQTEMMVTVKQLESEMQEDTEEYESDELQVFAEKIQEAMADKNQEELAELLVYPCDLITSDKEDWKIEDREDILAMESDIIFGDDLLKSIAAVDTGTLVLTEEGVVMGAGNACITIHISGDGEFGISQIRE